MVRGRTRSATILAIVSGKGGVGKSNIAVNLSICLAAKGLDVTLVDLDMGLANADLLMDIRVRQSISHVVSGACTLEEVCTDGPGGIRFVPGASGFDRLADLSDFERRALVAQLQKLENNTDIVVLDCGAGISKNVTTFAASADQVMVVTTPEPTALADAYATVKSLYRQRSTAKLGVFVNMAHSRAQAEATSERLRTVAKSFLNISVAGFGYMLHDSRVELAVQERCPFVIGYPSSNASACVAAAADALTGAWNRQRARGGFFRRVVGLFV